MHNSEKNSFTFFHSTYIPHSSLSGPDMFIEACLVQLTRSLAFEYLLLTSGDSTRSARCLC